MNLHLLHVLIVAMIALTFWNPGQDLSVLFRTVQLMVVYELAHYTLVVLDRIHARRTL